MATIINEPDERTTERVVERGTDTAGWTIAIIILIAVIAGLIWWFRYYQPKTAAPAQTPAGGSANINVTLPTTQGTSGSATTSGGQPGPAY